MIKRKLLDIIPLILGGGVVLMALLSWYSSPISSTHSFLYYLVKEKPDLFLTLLTLFAQYIITVLVFKNIDEELSGKWDVTFSPINWKGTTDKAEVAAIIGRGVLLLSKSLRTTDSYSGILDITFTKVLADGKKSVIHRGAYEVHFDRSTNFDVTVEWKKLRMSLTKAEVTGWSLALVEERSAGDTTVDLDYPSQNKCHYVLAYEEKRQLLAGKAKMEFGNSESYVEAHKI